MGALGANASLVLLVLAAAPIVVASPAALDTQVVVVPPSVDPLTGEVGTRGGYATVVAVADTAGTLTIVNADITAHDIISVALGPTDNPWCPRYEGHHPCPLFASPLVGLGKQALVEGIDLLVPGTTYGLYCSVHHWLSGTVVAI